MNNIKIICDTMNDVPQDIVDKYDIDVLPATIIFNEKEYKAGVDLNGDEFYKMLRESKEIPKTSQITYATFSEVFNKYINEGKTVLYLAGSSVSSGTYQSAMLAKSDIEGPLYIFDTYSLCIGGGMLAKEAAIMANEGKSVEEIIEKLEELKEKVQVYFSVDALDHLHKGGRISGAKAAVGTLLNIKPILKIEDGLVKQKSQVRGSKKIMSGLMEKLSEEVSGDFSDIDVYVAYNDDLDLRDQFIERVKEKLNPRNVYSIQIGSCVACHSGPDVLGIACLSK
ncbi:MULTISPECIES: DegV family protein [unclassified Romboutsia]|uniref:DegV family protein n=1 Tax=unclassified Romboutsia TaxID=2626894 RepID=UPI0008223736|nr:MULTISPECIES: DegV family protein [unclassified Romboutsia]SCH51100.1 EDD domain protein%2C DegV family [uncultured Clostridium sp.]